VPADGERRRLPRHHLDLQVEVVACDSGATLGVLVNVHLEGLLMMGDLALQPDHLYRVRLCPLASPHSLPAIELTIDCLWTRAMGQQDRVWAGCLIADLSLEARDNLTSLIEAFSRETVDAGLSRRRV